MLFENFLKIFQFSLNLLLKIFPTFLSVYYLLNQLLLLIFPANSKMISLLFNLNLLNAVLDVSSPRSPLLLIISIHCLFPILFQNFVLNILTIKFILLLIICFVMINLQFFSFLSVLVNNGIPLWFRCFKGKHNPQAYKLDLIKEGISFCNNLFADKNYHIIFLADRWFPHIEILSFIESIGSFYCIRSKSFFTFSYFNKNNKFITSHLRNIKPWKYCGKVLKNVFYTRKHFLTNIVVSNSSNTQEPWYIITNDDTSRAIRNYSYRFGSIETLFKSQKSNRF